MTLKEDKAGEEKYLTGQIDHLDLAWIVVGMMALGALVGFICGLSSAAVTLPLMGAIFSLIGGGITSLLGKAKYPLVRKLAGKTLTAFCASCGIFLIIGIMAKEYRWFTPRGNHGDAQAVAVLKVNKSPTLEVVKGLCANQQFETLTNMIEEKK